MRGHGKLWTALAFGLAALVIPSSASAATQIGETFPPPTGCDAPRTQLQTTSPNSIYAAPSPGVITSWSFIAAVDTQPELKLKVARLVGGNDFFIVGESAVQAPAPGVLNTFGTRISVQSGDVIGFHNASLGRCGEFAPPGYATHTTTAGIDPAPATTATFGPGMFHLDVSATLEPDADNDGFGDETQDACPTGAATQNECVPPTAQITKGPKQKTKKKTATFEFTGTDARAVAGFECALDGGAFAPCTSPHTLKVKKGKHTFQVRAVDQSGNVGTPASDTWKRTKKRRN